MSHGKRQRESHGGFNGGGEEFDRRGRGGRNRGGWIDRNIDEGLLYFPKFEHSAIRIQIGKHAEDTYLEIVANHGVEVFLVVDQIRRLPVRRYASFGQ